MEREIELTALRAATAPIGKATAPARGTGSA
jgi:hypothetical protein